MLTTYSPLNNISGIKNNYFKPCNCLQTVNKYSVYIAIDQEYTQEGIRETEKGNGCRSRMNTVPTTPLDANPSLHNKSRKGR